MLLFYEHLQQQYTDHVSLQLPPEITVELHCRESRAGSQTGTAEKLILFYGSEMCAAIKLERHTVFTELLTEKGEGLGFWIS